MSEKARQFRSLLLEPLECRSVFSADGLEVWHFSQSSLSFEFDRTQPAQHSHNEAEATDKHSSAQGHDSIASRHDFDGVKFSGRRSSHGLYGFGSSMHRVRFNDAPLPPPDGEGPSGDVPASALDSKPNLESKPNFDSKSVQVPTQPIETRIFVAFKLTSGGFIQSRDSGPANSQVRPQFDSRGSERVDSLPTGNSTTSNSTGTSSLARVPTSPSLNPTLSSHSQIPATFNSLAPASSTTGQLNLSSASSQALSSIASGTVTFDFSSQMSGGNEKSDGLGNQWGDDFRFTRPIPVPGDSIADQVLDEQASGLESLEKLLPGLAENHLRNRTQNAFDANQPNARDDKNWRPETTASVEVTFADGGMIALALNRDIAMGELEELSEDARSENKAWIANVGIFRALENGAVAATEYAGLTNRVTRNAASNASPADVSEIEGEVANLQFHPLLASTSAALGIVMLGLRRMSRKTVPLLFTSRKR